MGWQFLGGSCCCPTSYEMEADNGTININGQDATFSITLPCCGSASYNHSITDDFNRSNESPLASPYGPGGNYSLTSNQVRYAGAGTGTALRPSASNRTSLVISADVITLANTTAIGVHIATGTNPVSLRLEQDFGGNVKWIAIYNGTSSNGSHTFTSPDEVKIEMDFTGGTGWDIDFKVNNSSVHTQSVTLADVLCGGVNHPWPCVAVMGFLASGSTPAIDNLSIEWT